jgi:hypothetical protein
MSFLWTVTVGRYQRFGETYCLHLQVVPNETKAARKSSAQFCVTAVAQQSFHATLRMT